MTSSCLALKMSFCLFVSAINAVHGRLLRIILSSILHHSLDHMSDFTHHNTCLNILDALIEPRQDELRIDLHPRNINLVTVLLDDRSHLPTELQK